MGGSRDIDDVGSGRGWTAVEDLEATLRRRWQKGVCLRAHAKGEPFEAISLPIRGPKASDLVTRLDEVRSWVERFDRENRTATARQCFDLDHVSRRTRTIGDTPVPVRASIPTFDRLCALLGTRDEVASLDRVLDRASTWVATDERRTPVLHWIQEHPRAAIENEEVWGQILDVIGWIADDHSDRSVLDLRHLDVPGVDTKFVDRHRKILGTLLELVLTADRVDRSARTFAGRFGFRERSSYVRFRLLDGVPELPAVITEAELRVEELAALPLSVTTVFIVENRATYLAVPHVPRSIAIFGEGFGVTVLEQIGWLNDREVVYWGDIDTHGFAILDRLRQRVPAVKSILMDRPTLLDHLDHIVVEDRPTNTTLDALTDHEAALYRDLIEDRFGHSVRLEQERIRFSAVRRALEPWTADGHGGARLSTGDGWS